MPISRNLQEMRELLPDTLKIGGREVITDVNALFSDRADLLQAMLIAADSTDNEKFMADAKKVLAIVREARFNVDGFNDRVKKAKK